MRNTAARQWPCLLILAAASGLHIAPDLTKAQPIIFAEDFENMGSVQSGQQGPQGLTAQGWSFRNQSDPLGGSPAFTPNGATGWPYTGNGYLQSSTSSAGMFGAKVSNWAILPQVPGQQAGDVLSIAVLDGGYGATQTFFDIRYSPTGGTSTGSGPFDVGDFTQVLFTSEMPVGGQSTYMPLEVTLPGPGRIALRYHAPAVSNFMSSGTLYLDTLTIGEPPAPPCGLQIPEPGQIVTWPAAPTPYEICQDFIIPETATLILGPGATVEVAPSRNLTIEGTLIAQGTPAAPVTITGDSVSGLRIKGTAEFQHADLNASILLYKDASLEASDSIFRELAHLSATQAGNFVRLERCEVRSEAATFARTTVLDDVSITNPNTWASLSGHWRIGSLNSIVPITFIAHLQDRAIDNVTITGVTDAAAIETHGTGGVIDFHLGPNNSLTNNLYPVWSRFTGLTPDSTIPTTGNINNAIHGMVNASADLRSRISIPNFGIPYHFHERGTVRGDVRIEPGTVLKFGPLGGLTVGGDNGTDGTFRGLPGQPVILERLDPSQPWFSLATSIGWYIFEHLDIRGAGVGVVGNESELWLRDSIIRDCDHGAHPAADGNIYGSGVEFYGNQLALRDDVSNPAAQIKTGIHFNGYERPNIFEGNVLAARNFGTTTGHRHPFPAESNWWGHPTGPFEPLFHPQGQGDEISPFIQFQPFLNQRPDLSDSRPVVRLKTRLHPVVHPGEKVIVEWDAFDDGTIISFDIVMLDPDTNLPPGFHFITLGHNLPGSQRAFEITIPDVGLHPYERFPFRIIATDNAGNASFEQFWFSIPHQAPAGQVTFLTSLTEFEGGEDIEVCFEATNLTAGVPPRFYIETAADDRVSMSAATSSGCSLGNIRLPFASSDRVRLAIRAQGNWNRDEWYFTDYFTIRPDARIGDAPPQIEMLTPTAGQQFEGGTTIPITWTASDDNPLREFRIQASFNGGYTFHTIATSLPPTATSYNWRLPASSGISNVRLRIVAVDSLMQNSSSGDDRPFHILPGSGPLPCYANCDQSTIQPILNVDDFTCFINEYAQAQSLPHEKQLSHYANCDNSTIAPALNVDDFTCFINQYAAGCR